MWQRQKLRFSATISELQFYLLRDKKSPVKDEGTKCFHNGMILIVICFKLVLQI